MISQFQKRKKTMISAGVFLRTAALIVILIIIGFLVFSNIKIKEKRDILNAQIASIEKEIENLQKKNEELKEGISRVGDEEYVERIAREELNLQKEGEKVVGFILPPEEKEQEQKKNFWQPNSWREWIKGKINWIKNIF